MNRRDSLRLIFSGIALPFTAEPLCATELEAAAHLVSRTNTAAQPTSSTAAFTSLPLGEVRPAGWIRAQMVRDLDDGFAGKLDQLCPEASSDIFVNHRITSISENNWWNGETEGNWRAGHIQMAFLTDHTNAKQQAGTFVERVLASQGNDGYLGVFAPPLRYSQPGELWTQACLLRGLLDYAEFTHDARVQKAVERAAALVISKYRLGHTDLPPNVGGLGASHDLMISDVMERLYAASGNPAYRDFTLGLYEQVSRSALGADTSLPSLLNLNAPFRDHGVNTYETIRVPLWLWKATGREDLGRASLNALRKLSRYTEPGGSAVSQESILNLQPDPSATQYEYCSTKEIQLTLTSALQKTGEAALGDAVERIWFNAAQGSRLPDGSAIAYLHSDNCLHCDGLTPDGKAKAPGSKYSPTHRDVAVCCNPNAANVAALFVRNMWMRSPDGGLTAMLYGPATVSTEVHGVPLQLEEKTRYPFEQEIEILVRPARPVRFSLQLRHPAWSRGVEIRCPRASLRRTDHYTQVTKLWQAGDRLQIRFTATIQELLAVTGEITLQYGALLFAKPIPSRKLLQRKYALPGFEDSYFLPESASAPFALSSAHRRQAFGFEVHPVTPALRKHPFDSPQIVLRGPMINTESRLHEIVELVPLGNAPDLRVLTFPLG